MSVNGGQCSFFWRASATNLFTHLSLSQKRANNKRDARKGNIVYRMVRERERERGRERGREKGRERVDQGVRSRRLPHHLP